MIVPGSMYNTSGIPYIGHGVGMPGNTTILRGGGNRLPPMAFASLP